MTIHSTNATVTDYRAYAEAFRDGMRDACNGVKRAQAFAISQEVPVRQGDAYLAGYYAELRRLRNYEDLER